MTLNVFYNYNVIILNTSVQRNIEYLSLHSFAKWTKKKILWSLYLAAVKNVLQKIGHFLLDNSRIHSYHPVCETNVGHDRHMRAEFFREPGDSSQNSAEAIGDEALVEESLHFQRAGDIKGFHRLPKESTTGTTLIDEDFLLSLYRKRASLLN